jgi:hypothetical protein
MDAYTAKLPGTVSRGTSIESTGRSTAMSPLPLSATIVALQYQPYGIVMQSLHTTKNINVGLKVRSRSVLDTLDRIQLVKSTWSMTSDWSSRSRLVMAVKKTLDYDLNQGSRSLRSPPSP